MGRESVEYAKTQCDMGLVRGEQHRYEEAMDLYEEARGLCGHTQQDA